MYIRTKIKLWAAFSCNVPITSGMSNKSHGGSSCSHVFPVFFSPPSSISFLFPPFFPALSSPTCDSLSHALPPPFTSSPYFSRSPARCHERNIATKPDSKNTLREAGRGGAEQQNHACHYPVDFSDRHWNQDWDRKSHYCTPMSLLSAAIIATTGSSELWLVPHILAQKVHRYSHRQSHTRKPATHTRSYTHPFTAICTHTCMHTRKNSHTR